MVPLLVILANPRWRDFIHSCFPKLPNTVLAKTKSFTNSIPNRNKKERIFIGALKTVVLDTLSNKYLEQ